MLSRKLAHNCAKKITYLVNETDAISQPNPIPDPNGNGHQTHPIMAAFIELMEDNYLRFIIFGFSSIIQMITLECPSALVWNYFGENKTPSSLLASPLDFLPNCTPSGLPMPPSQTNNITRQKIKKMEMMIKERSIASEGKLSSDIKYWILSDQSCSDYSHLPANWSGDQGVDSNQRNVNTVLMILEELDSYVFDRIDTTSNSLDSLYSRLFNSGANSVIDSEDTLVHTLCEWAVTSMRSGEHRAFVVSKLLERRQGEIQVKRTDEYIENKGLSKINA